MTDSPESLVFGLDVGTTQSGAAVTYIAPDTFTFSERPVSRPPTVLEKLPGQTPGRAKIPSTLLYDREGNCLKKWGFQVDSLSRDEQNLIKQGDWLKVDWFKLHIDPQNSAATRKIVEKDSRQLPKNKTGHEVWGDFLLKLSSAAKQAAQEELGITLIDELEKRKAVSYVVTIPVAWQQDPVTMSKLRVQAHRIGLIQPDNPESLKFCSESEASALYCYEQTQHLVMEKDDCFVMMDAGGGTVDFTSYKVTQTEPLKFEEIGISSRVCLFAGSTFVDRTFEEVLQVHLEEAYPDTEVKVRHLKRAMEYFVTKTKLDFNIQQQTPTFWDISSDDDDFDEGGIEVPWAVVEAAFAPHVARIIDAIIDIVKDIDKFKSKYLFCSGGFGDSPYLRQCLEKHAGPTLKVIQPEQTSSSSGSKAVSLGACIFGTSTVVSKRIVPYYIGIKTSHPASDGQIATHPRRLRIEHGVTRLTGIYSVIVKKNTSVSEGEYHSEAFTIDFGTKERSLTMMITIYTYGGNAPPQFADEAGVENTGYFRVMIPKHMKGQQMRNGAGVLIVRYTVDCRIYCGETELRSEIIMAGKKIGQSSFLNEGHGPTSAV